MNKQAAIYAYIGTQTDGSSSEGIYVYRMNPLTGELEYSSTAAAGINPTYLAIHPLKQYLYAANTIEGEGLISSFAIDSLTGRLTFMNSQPSGGSKPVHVLVDGKGTFVLAGNFGDGSVSVLPIQADGSLGAMTDFIRHSGSSVHPTRQQGPRVHSVTLDPAGRYAVAAEYGADQLRVYRLDAERGKLLPAAVPSISVAAGSGPRHAVFHPNERWAYVINELGNTLMSYDYNPVQGIFHLRDTHATLPEGFAEPSFCADVHVHPDGTYVYGSNRGHNSIVIYAVEPETGRLQLVGHEPTLGRAPRSFIIDPTGQYLYAAHQDTDNVVAFSLDRQTGRFRPMGHSIKVPMPVCIKMISI
ncbi:lactonase family protein [Paenibacillus chondroitinus]|uniref:Lactonase family protein n=1 Tax=Paenibacillus chondroitinus TaxID=59842 RepID=A0ABU6DNN7_9BACL|nr:MULTISPECIES: lactonase family protein [Paenibacillus]MCY9663103.1 lactonase family protein [Paenibacillus anseongense]MEB4799224.1 lactonase family protein [Paenibacillus chondroitinus]